MNKEQIKMLVENALSEIFEDDEIDEGGPGSGRREGGGAGKGKTAGDKYYNSLSKKEKGSINRGANKQKKEEEKKLRKKKWLGVK